jgi:hypothetical protein
MRQDEASVTGAGNAEDHAWLEFALERARLASEQIRSATAEGKAARTKGGDPADWVTDHRARRRKTNLGLAAVGEARTEACSRQAEEPREGCV